MKLKNRKDNKLMMHRNEYQQAQLKSLKVKAHKHEINTSKINVK